MCVLIILLESLLAGLFERFIGVSGHVRITIIVSAALCVLLCLSCLILLTWIDFLYFLVLYYCIYFIDIFYHESLTSKNNSLS
jgi:hypothetical protein